MARIGRAFPATALTGHGPATATPTRGQISWAELGVPFVGTRGRIAWAEIEVPSVASPTRGLVSWAELAVPLVGTRGRISWAELEVPEGGGVSDDDTPRTRRRYADVGRG